MTHFSFGQCIVDAGPDKYICVDKFGNLDSTVFDAEISQGTAPYQIKWLAEYSTGLQSSPFLFATNFLSDTTALNPQIINSEILPNNEALPFLIHVSDSVGNNCMDSVNVYFSKFGLLPEFLEREILQGDTIELHSIVGNGIPPIYYNWFPDYNISNISIGNPKVWPDTTTVYDVLVTDSVGCVSNWSATEWTIHVKPMNADNIRLKQSALLYPNPIKEASILDLSILWSHEKLNIIVFNNMGRIVLVDEISGKTYPIGTRVKVSGEYWYQIYTNHQHIISGKMIRL